MHELFKSEFDLKIISELFRETERLEYLAKQSKHNNVGLETIYYDDIDDSPANFKFDNSIIKDRSSELGHYYRHLFQTVKFVDDFDNNILNPEAKYGYIKNLRAQLSNYEQILLYYNALSRFGRSWLAIQDTDILSSYMIKYKTIKNIPFPFANIGIRPEDKFSKEIKLLRDKKKSEELFEWYEITKK